MHEGLMKKGLRSLLLQVPVFSAFKIKGYLQIKSVQEFKLTICNL